MKRKEEGTRMIVLEVRFWANELAPRGKIKPKHSWTSGVPVSA